MIQGGYYLRAKRIERSKIGTAPPYMREIWDYLLRKASFETNKDRPPGTLYRTYQTITDDLVWFIGARKKKYKIDQVKKAMVFMRKHKMITTVQKPRGVFITICNYKEYQDWKNYESTAAHTDIPYDIKKIGQELNHESTANGYESTADYPHENTADYPHESTAVESQDINNVNTLETIKAHESTAEKITKAPQEIPRGVPPLFNIQQKSIDKSVSYKRILPESENEEIDFERDRRIFFQAFPGVKTYQTFDDNSDRKSKKLVKQFHVKDFMPVEVTMELEDRNSYGAGVYMAINETNGMGRKSSDIVKIRAIFADFDGTPIEPVWEYEPSMVIESSPGKYHAYWLSDDIPLEGFRQLQEGIAEKFESDPKVKDLPRVMRVPGFEHRKGEPFMTKIIHYSGHKFSFGLLTEMFPPPQRPKWSGEKYKSQVNYNGPNEYKGDYGAPQGGRNNHIVSRIGGMLKRGLAWVEIEREAFKEAASCSPP